MSSDATRGSLLVQDNERLLQDEQDPSLGRPSPADRPRRHEINRERFLTYAYEHERGPDGVAGACDFSHLFTLLARRDAPLATAVPAARSLRLRQQRCDRRRAAPG